MLNRIARQMPEDGYLVLGAAETVIGLTEAFKPLTDKRGLYVVNACKSGPKRRQHHPLRGGKSLTSISQVPQHKYNFTVFAAARHVLICVRIV